MIYDMNWVLEFWEVNLDISFLLIFYNRNMGTDEGGVGKHVQIELFLYVFSLTNRISPATSSCDALSICVHVSLL